MPRDIINKKIQTLIIKIGSSILSSDEGGINKERIQALATQIAKLKKHIPNILLVSSGAVAAGFKILGFDNRPKDITSKQASAAIGQSRLIWTYEQAFKKHNINVAQILLTKDDLSNRKRFLHAQATLKKLLEFDVVPIINENDTILVDELKYIETFGDNDHLSALIAGIIDADLLLILSDVNGLYTANPSTNKDAKIIKEVFYIDEKIISLAGESISNVGTGGMSSKLKAAKKALDMGCDVAIIKGLEPNNIEKFFSGKEIGTYFFNPKSSMKKYKFWISNIAIPQGTIIIDNGAKKALLENKSLLPKGICGLKGEFSAGAIVRILSDDAEIARGKTRYNSLEISKIMGHNSKEIALILGHKPYSEVIHINDLSLI